MQAHASQCSVHTPVLNCSAHSHPHSHSHSHSQSHSQHAAVGEKAGSLRSRDDESFLHTGHGEEGVIIGEDPTTHQSFYELLKPCKLKEKEEKEEEEGDDGDGDGKRTHRRHDNRAHHSNARHNKSGSERGEAQPSPVGVKGVSAQNAIDDDWLEQEKQARAQNRSASDGHLAYDGEEQHSQANKSKISGSPWHGTGCRLPLP